MKIEVKEDYGMLFKEVFNIIGFETEEGEKLSVCMRDGGFEIGIGNGTKYRIKDGKLSKLGTQVKGVHV